MPENFIKVAHISELPPGTMKEVTIGSKVLLLTNLGGTYHAIGGLCTHRQGNLAEGELAGDVVTCPVHLRKFNVVTGKSLAQPPVADEPVYKVKVEGNDILVSVE